MKNNYYEDAAEEFNQAFDAHVKDNLTLRHTLTETIAGWMYRYHDMLRTRDDLCSRNQRIQDERDTAIDRSLGLLSKIESLRKENLEFGDKISELLDENEKLKVQLSEARGGLDSVKQERDYLLEARESLRIEVQHLKNEVLGWALKSCGERPCRSSRTHGPRKPQPFEFWLQDRIDELSQAINDHTTANDYGEHLIVWANELASLQCKMGNLSEEENA